MQTTATSNMLDANHRYSSELQPGFLKQLSRRQRGSARVYGLSLQNVERLRFASSLAANRMHIQYLPGTNRDRPWVRHRQASLSSTSTVPHPVDVLADPDFKHLRHMARFCGRSCGESALGASWRRMTSGIRTRPHLRGPGISRQPVSRRSRRAPPSSPKQQHPSACKSSAARPSTCRRCSIRSSNRQVGKVMAPLPAGDSSSSARRVCRVWCKIRPGDSISRRRETSLGSKLPLLEGKMTVHGCGAGTQITPRTNEQPI